MWFFRQCAIGLLLLQSSLSFASPTDTGLSNNSSLIENAESGSVLQKRYPVPVIYDASVSPSDRSAIDQAFQDMQALCRAAANYNYVNAAGNVDGIYTKYFPQGSEAKIQALFKYLAGIPQQWGGYPLTVPKFETITIKRAQQGSDKNDQASTKRTRGFEYDITIYDRAFTDVGTTIQLANFRGLKTSRSMEFLGAILLHEVLCVYYKLLSPFKRNHKLTSVSTLRHATALVNPIQSFASATDSRIRTGPPIDDQILGIFGRCYGGFYSNMLKTKDANRAALNNDNYMYFALEAYYFPIIHPSGGFGKPVVDQIAGCMVVMGLSLFCYNR